jgi:hypothetical protein
MKSGRWDWAFPGDGLKGFRGFKVCILHASLVFGQYTGGACVFLQGLCACYVSVRHTEAALGNFGVFVECLF